MLLLFKKKKIAELSNKAATYARTVYVEPVKEPRVRYSRSYLPGYEPAVLTSHNQTKPKPPVNAPVEIKQKPIENYDSTTVRRVMTNVSESSDSEHVVRALKKNTNPTFIDGIIEQINKKQVKDSVVYKAAQLDRRLFSKMMSDRDYKPSKDTALAIIFALNLSLTDAENLLSRAGYTLSHSNVRDIIFEYFIKECIYDLNEINAVLHKLGLKTIGR